MISSESREADVLGPRDAHHHPEVALRGHVQEPAGGRSEEPEAVGPELGDQGQVALDDLGSRVSIAIGIRAKGP